MIQLLIACSLLTLVPLHVSKNQVLFSMQSGQIKQAIDLYESYAHLKNKHDFDLLKELAFGLLEDGAKSNDQEKQLLSLYGAGIAGISSSLEIYAQGMMSAHPLVQMTAIQLLGDIEDDRSEEILSRAFSSPFLLIQMEAAFQLAKRKSHRATGYIEGLMQKLPPPFKIYFPQLFAMVGNREAIASLQRLMGDSLMGVRLASTLAAAKYGRDDFLKAIRASATHLNPAEQEVAATALGFLKDSHSIPVLKHLSSSGDPVVQLAACRSLLILGEEAKEKQIINLANSKNLYAISLLGSIDGSEDVLAKLIKDSNQHVRLNAMMNLLMRRDKRALPELKKVLINHRSGHGYRPNSSPGRSLTTWKVIPSAIQYAKKNKEDIPTISLGLRERLLEAALELDEASFLELAKSLFRDDVRDLVPLLISLLENLKTEQAIALLKQQADKAGAPFIRVYATLGLYRLNIEGPYEERLFSWISRQWQEPLFNFRPLLPWMQREEVGQFQLTPEETSRLMIEAFEALADRHEKKGIEILLQAMRNGLEDNRYILAGLLIKAIH